MQENQWPRNPVLTFWQSKRICSDNAHLGVVSTGVNFFNPSARTSVFARFDVTFGDDIDGISAKAGMRYSW